MSDARPVKQQKLQEQNNMDNVNNKLASTQRQTRIRKKVEKTSSRPRLSVFRSNKYVFAQIIDKDGKAVIGLSEKVIGADVKKTTPTERAHKLGAAIAKVAIEKKIKEVVFDKGRFAYHGRVKAVADGAREGGLQF
jgi:large subunit ribosomal protein L18